MDSDTIQNIYQFACKEVLKAAEYVKSANSLTRNATTAKDNYADFVTEYDENTEKMLIKAISEKYPNHTFIGEETVGSGGNLVLEDNPVWIIDPIDGTTNFVHGFPCYAISIALFVNKQAVMGFVYDVARDLLYSAIKGKGSFCNGRPLTVTSTTELGKALIITEYGNQRDSEFLQFKIDQMSRIIRSCHGIRCLGSAALNMCAVAAGHADAYYEFGLHIWDMAAAYLIAEEAGAYCCQPNGQPLDLLSRKILVANSKQMAEQISSLISDFPVTRD